MSYSLNWAQRIVGTFTESCTRAEQIKLCICQTSWRFTKVPITPEAITHALVLSLSRRGDKSLWPAYKRLCKKTPLDIKLLEKVTALIVGIYIDHVYQLELQF